LVRALTADGHEDRGSNLAGLTRNSKVSMTK